MRGWGFGGRRRTIAAGTVALLGALALPASASAGTASITGSTLTYSAAASEENNVIVEKDASVFRVSDGTAPATAGAGCSQRSIHRVSCPSGGINLVEVLARDQDDQVQTLIGTIDANLDGGSGTDELTSDAGNDTLSAGRSSVNGFQEELSSGAGQDVLNGTTSPNGGSTDMSGGPDDDQLFGGPGNDSMSGDTGADDIQGGDGIDSYIATFGSPATITLDEVANDGGAGENDNVHSDVEHISGTTFADTMVGDAGDQSFVGFGGKDNIQGKGGDDTLQGNDGADTLTGGGGADTLQGGNDPDDMSGGAGNDIADYGDHSNKVTVTINDVANDGGSGGAEGDNVRTDVEDLRGGSNDDTLTGSTGDNQIQGAEGNDTLNGIGGDDELSGDFQFSSAGDDTLNGGDGDDRLFGAAGADDMTGGSGFDYADYSRSGFGTRTLTIDNVANDGAAGENDNVRVGVEGVIGGTGPDTITGDSGNNTLQGGLGADALHGAGGNDLLIGDACCSTAADDFDGGAGEDTVSYRDHSFFGVTVDIDGVADDGAFGGAEGDNVESNVEDLIGGDTGDALTGNNANNTIDGRNGNDTLTGGGGGDTLTGNFGFDTLQGQAGKDELNSRGDGLTDVDNCGTEADVAIADSFDTVNADCETRIP
jgi:Ca2+-binding RTX toxin-like protein